MEQGRVSVILYRVFVFIGGSVVVEPVQFGPT
jgi:hypothetical protein